MTLRCRRRRYAWARVWEREPDRQSRMAIILAILAQAILLCAGLLVWLAAGSSFSVALAGDPQETGGSQGRKGVDLSSAFITNRRIALTAGPDGPTFGLKELQNYTPPPPLPHSPVQPYRWLQYPAALNGAPTLSRQYLTETVTYLAKHEIREGDRNSSYVALTFDCEIGPQSTRAILFTLHEQNVRATFFIEGKYTYLFPEITREIFTGGHELGSHSFYHPRFTALSPVTATMEITYTEAAIAWAVGQPVPMRYFRFPYGDRNNTTRLQVASLGYQSVYWNMDPRGWEPQVSAKDVVAYVRRVAHPGGIIIMHCGCWDDAYALPEVIQVIREKGLLPGTLSDVLTPQDRDVPGY